MKKYPLKEVGWGGWYVITNVVGVMHYLEGNYEIRVGDVILIGYCNEENNTGLTVVKANGDIMRRETFEEVCKYVYVAELDFSAVNRIEVSEGEL